MTRQGDRVRVRDVVTDVSVAAAVAITLALLGVALLFPPH